LEEEVKRETKIIQESELPPFIRNKINNEIKKSHNEYKACLAAANIDKAIELLSGLLSQEKSTAEKRQELRKLFSSQCKEGDPIEYGYLKVIENKIVGGKEDYAEYLETQCLEYERNGNIDGKAKELMLKLAKLLLEVNDKKKSIHWFILAQDYESAWNNVKNSDSELINFAIKEFESVYQKYKNIGDNEDQTFIKVTWMFAELHRKVNKIADAIRLFIECKHYKDAYQLVDIHDRNSIDLAFTQFIIGREKEQKYTKILGLMSRFHYSVKDMFRLEPLPSNLLIKYGLLNILYAIYRIKSLFGTLPAVVIVGGVMFVYNSFLDPNSSFRMLCAFSIWIFMLGFDIYKQDRWIKSHEMYLILTSSIPTHNQLYSITGKYTKNLNDEKWTRTMLIILEIMILIVALGPLFKDAPDESVKQAPPPPAIEQSVAPAPIPESESIQNELIEESFSEDEARQAFINYHQNITNKNYNLAYEALTSEQKQYVGDFNHYVAGYSDTISSTVDDMSMISSEGNTITFSYNLTAQDNFQGNRIKIQKFAGQVTLVKVDTQWLILHAKSTKVDEYLSPTENEDTRRQEKNISSALSAQDLSLGNLTIHDREDKVQSIFGNPISSSNENNSRRLKFKDIEVVLRQGKVSALVSLSSAVTTPRGIHEGSSIQEVFDKYGTNYKKTSYGDETLYEYVIQSSEGRSCYLRFAINDSNGKVAYISVRFVQ